MKLIPVLLIGFLSFFYHFGFSLEVLDPNNIAWLMRGDRSGAFLGWVHFIHEPWQFPLGKLSNPLGGFYTSLSLMDALPWPSIILKALGAPTGIYQVHGYWFLLCYLLHAFFAYKLVSLYTKDTVHQLIAVCFLTLSPVLFYRTAHMALCAHWIVLWCLYLSLSPSKKLFKRALLWSFLCFLALGIHPYFILFCLTFSLFDLSRSLWKQRTKENIIKSFLSFSLVLLVSLFTMRLLNLLDSGARDQSINNLKYYVTDLFMFFNSGDRSFFVPSLWKFRMGQYEGFSYLGLGVLILFFLALISNWGSLWKKTKNFYSSSETGPAVFAITLLAFFSLGARIRILGHGAIDISLIYKPFLALLSSFRSNGRFIWALYYFLVLVLVTWAPKNKKSFPLYKVFLGFLLLIQLIDLSPLQIKMNVGGSSQFLSSFKEINFKNIEKIEILPPQAQGTSCPGYKDWKKSSPFHLLSAAHKIPINSGVQAHPPQKKFAQICKKSIQNLKEKKLKEGTLYIVLKDLSKELKGDFWGKRCEKKKNYWICLKNKGFSTEL